MKLTIDSEQRLFIVKRMGFFDRQFPCNFKQIEEVLKELEPNDEFKIYEVWNLKVKWVSRKRINEMFEAAKIDFKI